MNAAEVPALEARRLTKHYRRGRPPALDRVDLAIDAGDAVALVGPNGAGKSTLIRCFLGFERPTDGVALVGANDVRRARPAALARLAHVGQPPGLYPGLTVAAHLDLASALRSTFDGPGANARLASLGIEPERKTGELSLGQQAQVGLTIAIATRAPILLLDEPLAPLDPLARRDVLAMVRAAIDAGTTILFASHIVGDLAAVCDRLVILAAGRVLYDAPISEARARHVVTSPRSATEGETVGVFDDRDGHARALVRRPNPVPAGDTEALAGDGSPPVELDEVVLGYLARARTDSTDARAV